MEILIRPALRAAIVAALIVAAHEGSHGQDRVFTEYQVKAAYLYNFAKFVEWPPEAFASGSSVLVIGILGLNPFGRELAGIVEGKTVSGRKIVTREIERLEETHSCHILFISQSEAGRLGKLLKSLSARPLLTVSDAESFVAMGGMIGLITVENKIKFEINAGAVKRAGLKMSAKLLKLAVVRNG